MIPTAPALLIVTSLLTGAASFVYEIGWIRKRIDVSPNPGMLLAMVQIVIGGVALATVPLHSVSFDLFAFVVREAPRTDGGYARFNLVRYGIASLIMFPAAFCADMTLPLVTRILYARKDQGEKAIGLVYSANTVGAILGLVFAVNIALPVFGLEYVVASGAAIDVLLGAILFVAFRAISTKMGSSRNGCRPTRWMPSARSRCSKWSARH